MCATFEDPRSAQDENFAYDGNGDLRGLAIATDAFAEPDWHGRLTNDSAKVHSPGASRYTRADSTDMVDELSWDETSYKDEATTCGQYTLLGCQSQVAESKG